MLHELLDEFNPLIRLDVLAVILVVLFEESLMVRLSHHLLHLTDELNQIVVELTLMSGDHRAFDAWLAGHTVYSLILIVVFIFFFLGIF
jgi:hypothetical protein